MGTVKTTRKSIEKESAFGLERATPGILVAHAPGVGASVDRCAVRTPFTLGRSAACEFVIDDEKVSGRHCRIVREKSGFWLADQGSTNGTFLNGGPVLGPRELGERAVIRVGSTILVFHAKANLLLAPPPLKRFGLLGPFHAGMLVQQLQEAALSSRHLLLTGPSGVGKELAANALAAICGKAVPLEILAHNAARFTSEEEATGTLFGVGPKVFTNVVGRPGLIEQAASGVLFLDEIHNLPIRVQRALLRVIEDGVTVRIGETQARRTSVRFVFASNASPPDFGLAPDLLARLRRITIPTLEERVADVPAIFKTLLEQAAIRSNLLPDRVLSCLGGDHFEALCLDGFEADNVRGLIDITDRIVTRIQSGISAEDAVRTVFSERFHDGAVAGRYRVQGKEGEPHSHYEQNRELITAVFRECRGNLSQMERVLNQRGIKCTRRWLGVYAGRWGLRTERN